MKKNNILLSCVLMSAIFGSCVIHSNKYNISQPKKKEPAVKYLIYKFRDNSNGTIQIYKVSFPKNTMVAHLVEEEYGVYYTAVLQYNNAEIYVGHDVSDWNRNRHVEVFNNVCVNIKKQYETFRSSLPIKGMEFYEGEDDNKLFWQSMCIYEFDSVIDIQSSSPIELHIGYYKAQERDTAILNTIIKSASEYTDSTNMIEPIRFIYW